jgi:hypothetical protein
VHARQRRGGRRAEVDAADRGAVRVPPGHRARHGLPDRLHADGDVAADVVGVVRLLIDRGAHRPGQDEVAEARGEPLDLRLDRRGHVHVGPGGHVAVGPQRLPARRGAGRIGDARLDDEHVGTLRVLARRDLGLGRRDLLEGPAQVQRAGPAAVLVRPGHRAGQREVDLADPGAVAEPAQRRAVPGRQPGAGHFHQRAGGHVEQDRAGLRELGQGADPAAGLDAAAGRHDRLGHRVGDPGAAAGHDRPAHRVGQRDQHDPDARGGNGVERHHRVGGGAGHDGAGLRSSPAPDDRGGGQDAAQAVIGERQRVRGHPAQGGEQFGEDLVHVASRGAEQALVGPAVSAQARGRLLDRTRHDGRPAAVQRLGELHGWLREPHAPRGQVEAAEERRGQGQRVRRRADVVPEARQGQFLGAAPAADRGRALDHLNLQARRGQRDGSGQAVRAAADYHRVRVPPHNTSSTPLDLLAGLALCAFCAF